MASKSLPHITCVLFDMDGVLVDVSRSYRYAIARTAEKFTGEPVDAAIIQEFKNRGGLNDDWQLTAAIVQERGVEADFQEIVGEFQQLYRGRAWDGLIAQESPLMGGQVLKALLDAGLDVGIVTGRPEEEARWTLDRFGWSSMFSVLVAREAQLDRPKPHGFPIRAALEKLTTPHSPAQSVYVGDTIDDMRSALHAGVHPIGFVPPYLGRAKHGELLRRHGAHAVIGTHEELPAIVGVAEGR